MVLFRIRSHTRTRLRVTLQSRQMEREIGNKTRDLYATLPSFPLQFQLIFCTLFKQIFVFFTLFCDTHGDTLSGKKSTYKLHATRSSWRLKRAFFLAFGSACCWLYCCLCFWLCVEAFFWLSLRSQLWLRRIEKLSLASAAVKYTEKVLAGRSRDYAIVRKLLFVHVVMEWGGRGPRSTHFLVYYGRSSNE